MNRRRYLAGLLGGGLGGLAGCSGKADSPGTVEESSNSSVVAGPDGSPPGICERAARPERIPAIVDPAFAPDWDGVSATLRETTTVIGIERDGDARAYPIWATNEMVNDSFDVPVLVTFCPLCSSGLTAIRRVDGRETIFGNTGLLWRPPGVAGREAIDSGRVFGVSDRADPGERTAGSGVTPSNDRNLVMFDRATGSFWSQLLARSICGPTTGETLSLIPSTVANWGTWRERHPETSVLLPPPHSRTMEA